MSDRPVPRVDWVPSFAPAHIHGWYDERQYDAEDGLPETQAWGATCDVCRHEHKGQCDSGRVRQHIQRFALVHLHSDPMAAPTVEGVGSKRVKAE
jgi:hypothetical protein